jgi:hypothetical protein
VSVTPLEVKGEIDVACDLGSYLRAERRTDIELSMLDLPYGRKYVILMAHGEKSIGLFYFMKIRRRTLKCTTYVRTSACMLSLQIAVMTMFRFWSILVADQF